MFLLVLALGMAGLAAILVKTYLDKRAAELEASFADNTEKADVVVAKVDIPAGSRVVIDNFGIRQMPMDMIPPDAVFPENIDRVLGQSLKVGLPVGRPLLLGYLSSGTSPTFSDMLEENRRALTIAVDELNSISGMIRPYDRIDLFIISKDNHHSLGGKESKVVMPLLQDVLVKATGNIVRRETTADGQEYERRYSTLTLDLPPDEIGKVLIAQENGELKAALKRPEQQDANYKPTRESDLWPNDGGVKEGEGITFYIGGKGSGLLQSELQPFSNEVTGAETAETLQAQRPAEMGKIGEPMTKEQLEQLERHITQQREGKAAANGSTHPSEVSVASVKRLTQ